MGEQEFKKYFFWAIVAVIAIISYYIVAGFIVAIMSSFVFAYLLLPAHRRLSKITGKTLSAGLLLAGIIIFLVVLIFLIANTLISQFSQYVSNGKITEIADYLQNFLSGLNFPDSIKASFPSIIEKVGTFIFSSIYSVLAAIPGAGFTIFLTFFMAFFILVDWESLTKYLEGIIPFKNKKVIIKKVSDTSKKIVYGMFLIAIIEFVIALIGFGIAGVKFYALFAFLVAILAFIPLLGPVIIWVPLCIISLFTGDYFMAAAILITGLIISILIDGLLVQIIVGKKAKLNPVIVLIGVLGGVKLFGLFGFIIGPLVLSFFIDFLKAQMED
jgi:predicted PurR-regulated permease PerM